MIYTDENVEIYASLQCDVADSLKREHILRLHVIPKKATVLVQTFLGHHVQWHLPSYRKEMALFMR
jgi:hypothetical protein